MTLTAPTWAEHWMPDGRPCRCTGSRGAARLAPSPDLATWNASSSKRWNRFVQALRRELGVDLKVQYFKGTEVQRRGALHFHVVLRSSDGRPMALTKSRLRVLAIRYGFGHSVDVQPMDGNRATYCAKYVTKAADDRIDVPWDGFARTERVDTATGEVVTGRRVSHRATYRTWSASREWGRSMRSVRAAQAHHEAVIGHLHRWAAGLPASWNEEAARECPSRPRVDEWPPPRLPPGELL